MDDTYSCNPRPAGRNTDRRDRPVTPSLPPVQEPVAPLPGDENYPVVPLPPIVEPPAPDGGYPVVPLPPFVEPPIQEPVAPLPPDAGYPVVPLPPFVEPPQQPVYPGPGVIIVPVSNLCTVRFLNAASDYDPFRVTVDNRLVSSNMPFGAMSNYGRVRDGFHTVTIASIYSPYPIMFQRSVPFRAGELITMAIVRNNNGLELLNINDMPCTSSPNNMACIRAVNLCYQAPPLDVFLNDGRMVFSDVNYKEVTGFRQARPGDYGFYVAQTPYIATPYFYDIQTLEDVPYVAPNNYLPGYGNVNPLASFYIDAKRRAMYTIYMLGKFLPSPVFRVKVTEDFF